VGYTPRVLAKVEISIIIHHRHNKIIDLYDLCNDKIRSGMWPGHMIGHMMESSRRTAGKIR